MTREILEKKIAWYKEEVKIFASCSGYVAISIRCSELNEKIMLSELELEVFNKDYNVNQ